MNCGDGSMQIGQATLTLAALIPPARGWLLHHDEWWTRSHFLEKPPTRQRVVLYLRSWICCSQSSRPRSHLPSWDFKKFGYQQTKCTEIYDDNLITLSWVNLQCAVNFRATSTFVDILCSNSLIVHTKWRPMLCPRVCLHPPSSATAVSWWAKHLLLWSFCTLNVFVWPFWLNSFQTCIQPLEMQRKWRAFLWALKR